MTVSGPASGNGNATSGNRLIEPAEYQPPSLGRSRPGLPNLVLIAAVAAGLAVAGTLWFVLTMRAVEIRIDPEAEQVSLSGLSLPIGENWLARPGEYMVSASHPGYHDLSEPIEVAKDGPTRFEFVLDPLAGRLSFQGTPANAEIRVAGEVLGEAPLDEVELDGGEYALEIRHPEFLPERRRLVVEGRAVEQDIEYELTPSTAEIGVSSMPADAEIRINGESAGRTPASLKLDVGEQRIELSKPGYRTWSDTLEVVGGEARELPAIVLEPASATLSIRSEPGGAEVRLDGRRVGTTPLERGLDPGEPVAIELAMDGYQALSRTITLQPGVERTVRGQLVPINATLAVSTKPSGARLYIDGNAVGTVGPDGLELELPARDYTLEFRLDGHADEQREIRLDPDESTTVTVEMMTELEARMARVQPLIRAADGQTLKLVEPGGFEMGSPRGQQGRRPNETKRPVELERLFYMGTHEVTNEQFRRFRPAHSSGIVGDETLDNDEQPVARVDFDDAAAYCNWLSDQDGLEPAYRRTRHGYRLIEPVTRGYRLPSEAEWAWVARFADDREMKYPWGHSMPPEPGSGNFAGQSARDLVASVLPAYDDGHPATAMVGAFEPNAIGFHDLGGNVSEWTGADYENLVNRAPELEVDPVSTALGSQRVVRGSSWRHAGIGRLRLAWRDPARDARDDLGFRVVRYAE